MALPLQITQQIAEKARDLGFQLVAVTRAEIPESHAAFFDAWLEAGHDANMDWIARRRDERVEPARLLPGAVSILTLGMLYNPPEPEEPAPEFAGQVARYAWGRDYHQLVNKRLRKLRRLIAEVIPGVDSYVNVDTGPVLERSLAEKAGIGWIGHNTCLIHPELGSYFFLAEVLLDTELAPLPVENPHMPNCGTCRACIDVCPTDAFEEKGVLDSERCISYQTIENRGTVPESLREGIGTWVFGCDLCQQVCPWNREAPLTEESDFHARPGHAQLDLIALLRTCEEDLEEDLFLGTPIRRPKGRGLKRNAIIALGNLGDPCTLPILKDFADGEDELLAEHARWAIERIRQRAKENPGHPTARALE